MRSLTTEVRYKKFVLPAILRGGEPWVGAQTLCAPLGLTSRSATRMIMRRHPKDFGPEAAQLLVGDTAGGPQQLWFVNRLGAENLAWHAGTDEAREFRLWIRDDWRAWRAGDTPAAADTPSIREPLGTQARRVLEVVAAHAEPGSPLAKLVVDIRDGRLPLAGDPLLSRPLARWREMQLRFADAKRLLRECVAEVNALGYTEDEFKAIARWHKRSKESISLPMLPGFDETEASDA